MNKKIIASMALIVLLAMPVLVVPGLAVAASLEDSDPGVPTVISDTTSVWSIISAIMNFLWPVFIGFAVIMLIVAGFLFLAANGDPTKIGVARMAILWCVVGVVAGIIAFSLPFIIQNTIC